MKLCGAWLMVGTLVFSRRKICWWRLAWPVLSWNLVVLSSLIGIHVCSNDDKRPFAKQSHDSPLSPQRPTGILLTKNATMYSLHSLGKAGIEPIPVTAHCATHPNGWYRLTFSFPLTTYSSNSPHAARCSFFSPLMLFYSFACSTLLPDPYFSWPVLALSLFTILADWVGDVGCYWAPSSLVIVELSLLFPAPQAAPIRSQQRKSWPGQIYEWLEGLDVLFYR